jgi:hypothetical protein
VGAYFYCFLLPALSFVLIMVAWFVRWVYWNATGRKTDWQDFQD